MKKIIFIADIIFFICSVVCFILSKLAYHIGGMVMDGPSEYYVKWGRICDIFEKCSKGFLIAGIVLLVLYLLFCRKK